MLPARQAEDARLIIPYHRTSAGFRRLSDNGVPDEQAEILA
jgi:hypothetical protein